MCVAGQLRHPNSQDLLRKRTQVLTTSRLMAQRLEQMQCAGDHVHDSIAGSCRIPGGGRQSLTKYSENYTKRFARLLTRIIQCSIKVHESQECHHCVIMYDTLVVNAESESAPPAKRRRLRLSGKSPADQLYEPLGEVDTLEAFAALVDAV